MARQTINNSLQDRGRRRKPIKMRVLLQYFFAILLTIIMFFPLYWMLISSLKSTEELLLANPTFWPQSFHFENFATVFINFPMFNYMKNTIIVTMITTVLHILIGILAAYAFSKGDFPCKDLLFLLVLGALMIPMQVTFLPIYIMVSKAKWLNTYIGLILPEAVSAYFIFMLRQNFRSVDNSYLEAGYVDGMGVFGSIFRVLVPMCRPTIITVGVVSFIGTWNSYFWPKIVTTKPTVRTVSIALAEIRSSYAGNEIYNFNIIMAASLVMIIPVIVLYLVCQKYILTGFSKAAMK